MHPKRPTLVIYWTDTRELLTYSEKQDLEFMGNLISVTPQELLIESPMTGRKAAIRGVTDEFAPDIPRPVAMA